MSGARIKRGFHRLVVMVAALTATNSAISQDLSNTAKDFDLMCAVAASIDLANVERNTHEFATFFTVLAFYVGRLSARDDRTNWPAVVKGRTAERRGQPTPDSVGKVCIDFFARKLD